MIIEILPHRRCGNYSVVLRNVDSQLNHRPLCFGLHPASQLRQHEPVRCSRDTSKRAGSPDDTFTLTSYVIACRSISQLQESRGWRKYVVVPVVPRVKRCLSAPTRRRERQATVWRSVQGCRDGLLPATPRGRRAVLAPDFSMQSRDNGICVHVPAARRRRTLTPRSTCLHINSTTVRRNVAA